MTQAANSPMCELNLLMWAAEPGRLVAVQDTTESIDYSSIHAHLGEVRQQVLQQVTLKPIFHGEPIETVIFCCRSLLQRGSYGDDDEAHSTLFVASELVAVSRWNLHRQECMPMLLIRFGPE